MVMKTIKPTAKTTAKAIGAAIIALVLCLGLLTLVGCGPQEDRQVQFMLDCKQKLSAEECQSISHDKAMVQQYQHSNGGSSFFDSMVGGAVGAAAGTMIGNSLSNRQAAPAPRYYDAPRQPSGYSSSYNSAPARTYTPPPAPSKPATSSWGTASSKSQEASAKSNWSYGSKPLTGYKPKASPFSKKK